MRLAEEVGVGGQRHSEDSTASVNELRDPLLQGALNLAALLAHVHISQSSTERPVRVSVTLSVRVSVTLYRAAFRVVRMGPAPLTIRGFSTGAAQAATTDSPEGMRNPIGKGIRNPIRSS